jgi:hypothetical protein
MAVAEGLFGPGTAARRTVILGPSYLVDGVEVEVPADREVDLPVHPLARVELPEGGTGATSPASSVVGSGYDAVTWLGATEAGAVGGVLGLLPRTGETVLLGTAPGPPSSTLADGAPRPFLVRRAAGPGGWWQAWSRSGAAAPRLSVAGQELIVEHDEQVHRFRFRRNSVRIVEPCGNTIRLAGRRSAPETRTVAASWHPGRTVPCTRVDRIPEPGEANPAALGAGVALGVEDFRRAEVSHADAGGPHADVHALVAGRELGFVVNVRSPHLRFWSGDGPAAPDNEPPEILVDGVQCYVDAGGWRGVVAVPAAGGSVRVRAVETRALNPTGVRAAWAPCEGGYVIVVGFDLGRTLAPGEVVAGNVVVNCTAPNRLRRIGQLCLSDGGGWVYLRGDRESRRRAAALEVT